MALQEPQVTHPEKKNHIFLSYSSDDRPRAQMLAQALQAQGFDVWWDVDIPTGVHYPRFIEGALKSASCVVVLWSANSAGSRWVRNEADWGAENDTLVPVKIDQVDIPWEFRNFQTLDLSHWGGEADDPAFLRLLEGLATRATRQEKAGDRDAGSAAPAGAPAAATGPVSARPAPAGEAPSAAGGSGLLRWLVPAAIVLVVAVVAFLVGKQGHDPEGSAVVSSRGPLYGPPEQVTGDGRVHNSALSPDGKSLVFTHRNAQGHTSLLLKHLVTGDERNLVEPTPAAIRSPLFSPDGSYIHFTMQVPGADPPRFDLFRISSFGSPPFSLVQNVMERRFDFSHDGQRLVFKRVDGDTIRTMVAAADGSGERCIAVETPGATQYLCLAWSGDDTEILTVRRHADSGADEVVALPLAGGPAKVLPGPAWQFVMDLRTLPRQGGLLVVGKPRTVEGPIGDLWWLPQGGDEFVRLTRDMNQYYQVSADRTGERPGEALALSFYRAKRILRVIDVAGEGRQTDVSTDIVINGQVEWTDNEALLANQSVGGRVGLVEIRLADGQVNRIPTDREWVAEAVRSPDNTLMAYQAFSGEGMALWLSRADGGRPRRLTEGDAVEYYPQFTPDGRWLVYGHRDAPGQPIRIWRRPVDGGPGEQLSTADGWPPVVSPDGSRILAHFTAQHVPGFISVDGGDPVYPEIPGGFQVLTWNPPGDGFTAVRRQGDSLVIFDLPLSGGEPRQLVEFSAGAMGITDADWSPDGNKLALSLQMVEFDVALLHRLAEDQNASAAAR